MAGQNIGVGNWKRVKSIAKYGVLYSFSIMVILGILAVFLAEFGIRLFMKDQSAVTFGTQYLQIVALCYPFIGINFLLNVIVRSSGAMYQVLALTILSFWVLRFPLASFMSNWPGELGLAVGIGMMLLLSCFVAF